MAERQTWSFEGRCALVTGAGQGIGGESVRLMAERGLKGAALVGRTASKLEAMAHELERHGCKAVPVAADLADVQDCFRAVDEAVGALGALHCLVNAAGMTDRGSIDDTSPELFEAMFATNVRAPFFLTQRALPHLRKDAADTLNGATIVNIASIVSHCGPPFISAYCASKAALVTLSKNVANAVSKDRVRCNALNMGWTHTPHEHEIQTQQDGRSENWLAEIDAKQPMGRLLRAADVARAVAFLASDESGLMTGSAVDFEQHVIGAFAEASV